MSLRVRITGFVTLVSVLTLGPAVLASAHVVVTPSEVATGASQLFTISAPNEREQDFTALKLDIPEGLNSVSPTVMAGWNISETKTGEGETAPVTSITWSDGVVPSGQRISFEFKAKAPSTATKLNWKVYQTYADGTLISWDQAPTANEADNDNAISGPFSITSVVAKTSDEIAAEKAMSDVKSAKNTARTSLYIAVVALLAGLGIFGTAVKSKK